MVERIRPYLPTILLLAGWLLAALGYWGAWVWAEPVGLRVPGIDLAEYVKFVAEVRSGQISPDARGVSAAAGRHQSQHEYDGAPPRTEAVDTAALAGQSARDPRRLVDAAAGLDAVAAHDVRVRQANSGDCRLCPRRLVVISPVASLASGCQRDYGYTAGAAQHCSPAGKFPQVAAAPSKSSTATRPPLEPAQFC